ncbi:MAG: TIGR02266 family protein [Proteobacteria bacterium]|nr:TIGR02266 family protein [Pseudomonadota bacterium]
MTDREHDRMPYRVHVEFRTASSFLVAYSVNLSRGGLFLETDEDVPTGSVIDLDLRVPGSEMLNLSGVVTWRRPSDSPDGPPGLGIEFQDVLPTLGTTIDRLVSTFHGVHILVLSGDRQDRTTLARLIKSIISTAEIVLAADAGVARSLMSGELDLAVIDVDFDTDGALAAVRAAKEQIPPVPTVAISTNPKLRETARAAGADELGTNPPAFAELQLLLVRALSKPVLVRQTVMPPPSSST